jgi:N-acyl-D-amino-acid deacylase
MGRTLQALIATIALTLSVPYYAAQDPPQYDVVIANGRIVDGTGNPWFIGSVAIKDNRIVQVGYGSGLGQQAARVINADGMVVAPGFIDVHTHVEGNIGENPAAENFLRMGVTSIVTGNCGRSETDVGSFLAGLQSRGISVNVATLVGHGSVRRAIMDFDNRPPTPEELGKMREMVERAMRDGAVGLSTGLIYVPGAYARTDEIIELARVAARFGGVYASHMRDEGNLVTESIVEALTIGEKADIPVEISHFKISSKRRWGASRVTCKMVADARAKGQQVTVDQYVYTASSTSLDTLLPSWALEGGRDAALAWLKDRTVRARISREMLRTLRENRFPDFSYAVVSRFTADPSFEGKNIAEITRLARGRASIRQQIEQNSGDV